ncbi:MAG TPA: DUF3795 domain-containing protein [candidate division WOR-3 bacterium]|uniref:DUF3795 domain-containing protein n=1 Tax=candidate division WOR-3 bacterium TaxID=2052148 RepID=A0A9C9EKJ3_UNCW3|nr:DUF3795 domain-containing protein [candidate division WOR-3 bacterium]
MPDKTQCDLIGRCGLYCGACDIYRAWIDKDEEKLKGMAKYFRCAPEQIRCSGCQSTSKDKWSGDCKIVQCLDRNHYQYCYECALTEQCDIFQKLNKRYKDMPGRNLTRLKKIGEECFLKEQKFRWSCPECRAPVEYGAEKCRKCGADLNR